MRLKDGRKVTGRYVVVEAGVAQASHDKDFRDNPNFIHDGQGRNMNTRDYTQKSNRDTEMQKAQDFRLQNVQTVSSDGIVLDGNCRQIAGDIAAGNGTDTQYIGDLADNAEEYGIDAEGLARMRHPRVYFQTDPGQLDYSARTFDLFNIEDQKAGGSVETGDLRHALPGNRRRGGRPEGRLQEQPRTAHPYGGNAGIPRRDGGRT